MFVNLLMANVELSGLRGGATAGSGTPQIRLSDGLDEAATRQTNPGKLPPSELTSCDLVTFLVTVHVQCKRVSFGRNIIITVESIPETPVKHVAKKESLSKPVLDALVTWFGESDSYDTAEKRAKMILNEFDFTPSQVKKIRQYIKKNSQIHETKEARDSIFKFIDKYSSYFDDKFRDWYDSKRASRMWMKYLYREQKPTHNNRLQGTQKP